MKFRKFTIDDIEVLEQEPHFRTVIPQWSIVPYRIFLPYSLYFFRIWDSVHGKTKTMQFGFATKKWKPGVPLLLPPINTIFDEGLLCCCRPTLDDWWSQGVDINWNFASGKIMKETFGAYDRWSMLSKNKCWDIYHNWPKTMEVNEPEFFSDKTLVKTIVEYEDVSIFNRPELIDYVGRL